VTSTSDAIPIVCDLTDAPDTAPERIAEFGRLFSAALLGRERNDDGIRFRFRSDPGVEDWVLDLAAREKACCAWYVFGISTRDDELWWDVSVVDDDLARRLLDELYELPETMSHGSVSVPDYLPVRD
jgi:hypothetical protein